MKRNILKSILGLLVFGGLISCDNYLDINENPNQPTSVSPELVLPQAIVYSAAVSNTFNNYGGHFGGYIANAGGFSGFGNLFNYNLVPANFDVNWTSSYDNLEDLKYVIDATNGIPEFAYSNATAKIIAALTYQRLVDAFGDIPYSEALMGSENTTPAYDDAQTVYVDLISKLDSAILQISDAEAPNALTASSDPLFAGDMELWQKFANTLKLRMLLRISSTPELAAMVDEGFGSLNLELGFIEDDALVNPGYVRDKPNPVWNTWGYNANGNVANTSRIPTLFSFGFYNGRKLTDNGRGAAIFKDFAEGTTPVNQLGNEDDAPPIVANYPSWYSGVRQSATSISNALGVLKGPSQGQVLMLAAEAYFLVAEAQLNGFLEGDADESFDMGMLASFQYLYKDVTGAVASGMDPEADLEAYKKDNPDSYLVNYSLATTDARKLEAIITQKYIALNMINSDESWNEYRRTGYPLTNPLQEGYRNMAALASSSSRPDRLPTRVLYPSSEFSFNPSNVRAINQFSDRIFWDPN